jgi:hypothetical protein
MTLISSTTHGRITIEQVKDSENPGPPQATVSTFPRTFINKKNVKIAGNLAVKRSECTPARMR